MQVDESSYENDEAMAEFGRGIIDQYVFWSKRYGEPSDLRGWASYVQMRIVKYLLDEEAEPPPRAFAYVGTCAQHPFPTVLDLEAVIDGAREITKRTFMRYCRSGFNDERLSLMRQFPNCYRYYKSKHGDRLVYYFEWSRIEHFWMEEESCPSGLET